MIGARYGTVEFENLPGKILNNKPADEAGTQHWFYIRSTTNYNSEHKHSVPSLLEKFREAMHASFGGLFTLASQIEREQPCTVCIKVAPGVGFQHA